MPVQWLTLSASGRADWHSKYGSVVSPRLSALMRAPGDWTVRVSGGSGFFAPTPFTEETEVIGLAQVIYVTGTTDPPPTLPTSAPR